MKLRTSPPTLAFEPGRLTLLDQTRLPSEVVTVDCHTVQETWDAIRRLVVRGAPAIGIAAAYGVCLARRSDQTQRAAYVGAIDYLATSRPTAVNLFWALDRMRRVVESIPGNLDLATALQAEAVAIHAEDRQLCHDIGRHGARLLTGARRVLTHCNAGGLATSGWGTALAPIYHLHQLGQPIEVFADETRPLWQGARLTAWELAAAGVPVTVLTDSMAGSLLRTGTIDAVIVGADRIAANGDTANKIGTYPLAVLAHYHQVPFYVAAPSNTFDPQLASGNLIPIEQRDPQEVSQPHGITIVPERASVMNPAFDVTPAELIRAIITERGVIAAPSTQAIASLLSPGMSR
jgi:methylthioribose-1-phosphate isomerase